MSAAETQLPQITKIQACIRGYLKRKEIIIDPRKEFEKIFRQIEKGQNSSVSWVHQDRLCKPAFDFQLRQTGAFPDSNKNSEKQRMIEAHKAQITELEKRIDERKKVLREKFIKEKLSHFQT